MILRAAFHLLYNQLAFTYEWVAGAVSLGQWTRWRQAALAHLSPGKTLELAFGTGVLFSHMAQAKLAPVGIDLSPYMARITARRLRQSNLPRTIARARAEALPFPNGHFSNIIATFPTDYIFSVPALVEIRRVLSPKNGRLIVVLQGDLQHLGWINTAIEWLYRVTGQRAVPFQTIADRFGAAGFSAARVVTTVQGATAIVVVAKPTE